MPSLHFIDEPPSPAPPRFALFALGFRPFYLLASLYAALSVPLWVLQFSGLLPQGYLKGPVWHAHEMLFGFALAVIVGFLFTAGRNWTGQPTPTGATLAALAGLWVAARVLVLTPYGAAAAMHAVTWLVEERGYVYAEAAFAAGVMAIASGIAGNLAGGAFGDWCARRRRDGHLFSLIPMTVFFTPIRISCVSTPSVI